MTGLRLGCGAGFSGDRIEPAVELARHGALDYLIFECLAERTIALAQLRKLADPELGYDPLLEARFRAVLAPARANGTVIITNMGAANPISAARRVAAIAAELGFGDLRIACVTGDDVLDHISSRATDVVVTGRDVPDLGSRLVSANAYLGASGIVEALAQGADVVITGRVADPALFLAPIVHHFGWAWDDWERLGKGVLVGHLMECAGQITGGYFADPGKKDVMGLARLGFPIAEVVADGSVVITKLKDSGGAVSRQTCTEQLLYEIADPARYLQPDVVADFSNVTFEEIAPNRVRVSGGSGRARPDTLKVSVGYRDGFVGEGQIGYAGTGAGQRARLAADIVRERFEITGLVADDLRFDLLALDGMHRNTASASNAEPYEVRLRVAGATATMADAVRIGDEVEALYTNGPAGGGGATKNARANIAVASALIPAADVTAKVVFVDGVDRA